MKRTTLFVLSLLLVANLPCFASDYTITFTGVGASTTVDSVIVQNFTKKTMVTVPAGNVLNLINVLTADEQLNATDETIRVYANSEEGKSTLSFFAKQAGVTQINAFSLDGRKIAGITENLQTGVNSFQLSLPNGFFVIQVSGNGFSYTAKMMNQKASLSKPEITYTGTEKPLSSAQQKSKSSSPGTTTMIYTAGDELLYKAVSGNNSTIVTDIPTESKTTNFGFVDFTDADGNYYTSVTIGTQTWMAENLKTTHYRNGEAITNVTDNTAWAGLSTSAWCDYSNLPANGTKYGHLYNWYAVTDLRNIAPVGWHVPTHAEWTTLTTYLGGLSSAGDFMRKAGFSALPGGTRDYDGTFEGTNAAMWWSSTQEISFLAIGRFVFCNDYYDYGEEGVYYVPKATGFSVRCVKDNVPTVLTVPTITTTTASAITTTTATSGGNVTDDGGAAVTARGICWSTTATPTVDLTTKTTETVTTGVFTSSMSNITANTKYYVRAYATNSIGTAYGTEISFTTQSGGIPTVTTTATSVITTTSAISGGNVTDNGGGVVTARGICWSTTATPTVDLTTKTTETVTTGVFTSSITNLTANTTYNVRAYATNSSGTAYGTEISFTTQAEPAGDITDIDGNVYTSVTIGTQTWMVENLKTTHYRNGDAITNVIDNTAWAGLSTGAWCDYSNAAANGIKYGHLYNWYAANDSRNIAPIGWHVPTDAEWATLITYLGGESVAGGKLKETGTFNWASPNTAATNSFGFSALPGGDRNDWDGTFEGVSNHGIWWSSNQVNAMFAWGKQIFSSSSNVNGYFVPKAEGFSVRCIKN